MTDIWIPELHDIYHDYRKLARYATLLLDPSDGDIGFGDLVMRNITNQTNVRLLLLPSLHPASTYQC